MRTMFKSPLNWYEQGKMFPGFSCRALVTQVSPSGFFSSCCSIQIIRARMSTSQGFVKTEKCENVAHF